MNSNHKETVLITGASSGIGYELAREFAKHGHDLVIVAPIEPELRDVASRLTTEYGVNVKPIAEDLRRESAADDIFAQVAASGLSVEILVNNAGLGRRGHFWEISLEDDISMIRLNVEAGIRLTKRFLPAMLFSQRGRILNTASVAGFEPGPLLAVYHATKAFVLSWSEALATELKDTGVTLTVLCPGPVDTDFFEKADMVDTHAFQDAQVMAPQEVASTAYQALMDGERVVVPGLANKAMVFGRRLMPESAQAAMNEKMYGDTDPEERKRERGDVEAEAEAEAHAEPVEKH
ncbi:MAG: short-chain dehydrogenase/reductase [Rariglobus sp.]|jgi:short-subunit dehydrogenase|nr:short-chain dehydrogenase/reductase [Rariglobus sp.]